MTQPANMQTVLIIEDDPDTLLAWTLVVRSFGFAVLEAGDRGEAWRACRQHQGPVHLLLMRAILDNDTSEFVARLRLLYPQIRALFVSDASPAELTGQQPMPCECAFLQKPVRAEALADTMRHVIVQGGKA